MARIDYIDPYVDWAIALDQAKGPNAGASERILPVFFEGDRDAINAAFQKTGIDVYLPDPSAPNDAPSIPKLRALRQEGISWSDAAYDGNHISGYYLARQSDLKAAAQSESLCSFIRDVGVPLDDPENAKEADQITPIQSDGGGKSAIVAIIDDGIGYLNARFRRAARDSDHGHHTTRFLALWQQSMHLTPGAGDRFVNLGRVLSRAQINADLARLTHQSEFEIYRDRNAEVFSDRTHRSTEQTFSHGTAVLDLAAGAAPGEGAADADILAVQLPPETLEDTSGMHLPAFLLMGLDWLLAQARAAGRPIVINVSLGFSAGTKTQDVFLERVLQTRIDRFNDAMKAVGAPAAQLVCAYGNSHRDRLTARFDLVNGFADASIGWNIQPDDHTPSFLHIHRVDAYSSDLNSDIGLILKSPSGDACTVLPLTGDFADLIVPDGAGGQKHIGRIYQDKLDGPARITIALAPTHSLDGKGLVCEAGTWTVDIHRLCNRTASVVLQVQRDDTAAGFARGGRQSYPDHPNGYELDPLTRNYEKPDGGAGLTRKGTNSAIAAHAGASIHLVGSLEPDLNGDGASYRPTYESAQSDDWSERAAGPGPSFSVTSEDGAGAPGVLASGTFSDTTVLVD
ncbi:MAG: hypothetical protein AAF891_10155, partial [Pseudomonadota bacterium]